MTRGIGWPDPVPMRTRNAERAYFDMEEDDDDVYGDSEVLKQTN